MSRRINVQTTNFDQRGINALQISYGLYHEAPLVANFCVDDVACTPSWSAVFAITKHLGANRLSRRFHRNDVNDRAIHRPLRPHVSNDAFLQKISDIVVVGIPSAFLLFFGFTCLSLSVVGGAMISVILVGVFVLFVFQR